MKRFRGELVFKAHRLLHHSTLGPGVEKEVGGTSSKARGSSLEPALFRKSRAAALVRESNLPHPSLGITELFMLPFGYARSSVSCEESSQLRIDTDRCVARLKRSHSLSPTLSHSAKSQHPRILHAECRTTRDCWEPYSKCGFLNRNVSKQYLY